MRMILDVDQRKLLKLCGFCVQACCNLRQHPYAKKSFKSYSQGHFLIILVINGAQHSPPASLLPRRHGRAAEQQRSVCDESPWALACLHSECEFFFLRLADLVYVVRFYANYRT